jgi:hypothetical protein
MRRQEPSSKPIPHHIKNSCYCESQLPRTIIPITNFFEADMLILQEPISGTSSFTRLQLVPNELVNIVFIAFHTTLSADISSHQS